MISIKRTDSNFERESLAAPFGFKGGYIDELWQIAAMMESENGNKGVGLGVQSILWSDPAVFARGSQSSGNSMMYLITEYALKSITGTRFKTPVELLDQLIEEVYGYGKKITGRDELRMTFVLNALVAVDNAAWVLYAREKGIKAFDDMLPKEINAALSYRQVEER